MNHRREALVMLPFSGGFPFSYRPLEEGLNNHISTHVFCLPGRGARFNEPLCRDFNHALDDICDKLNSLQEKDVFIFGHSFGAVLAYELAHRLEFTGVARVKGLILTGSVSPCMRPNLKYGDLDRKELTLKLKGMGFPNHQVYESEEFMDFFMPIIQADLMALDSYVYQVKPRSKVPALIATGNEDVISTGENISKWSKHFTTEPEYQLFSGGHFFIFEHLTDFISAILKFVNKNSSR